MALEYKVKRTSSDSHQLTPFWIIKVIRFANRRTLDVNKLGTQVFNVSSDEATSKPVEEMLPLYIGDCHSWSLSSSKSSHISAANFQCMHSDTDYTTEIVPGDWVLMWVLNSKSEYDRVLEKIKNDERSNAWGDGFKFMGRMQTINKSKVRSANGPLIISYQMMAAGFTELDNQIFYHPAYSAHFNTDGAKMGFWLSLDKELQGLMSLAEDSRQPLKSQVVVPRLLKALLGQDSVSGNAGSTVSGGQAPSPNSAYLVPNTVSKLVSNKYSKTYDRLLRAYIGIQKYSGTNNDPGAGFSKDSSALIGNAGSTLYKVDSKIPQEAKVFIPELRGDRPDYLPSIWYETSGELGAQFLFLPGPFTGQSVWSIIYNYVNAPIDEMYTCMRVDPYGYIMPTLMVRQTCFNSMQLVNKNSDKMTAFVNLPRWVIDDSMITNIQHGTSESQRLNYVHLLGKDIADTTAGQEQNQAMVRNPPEADLADICRSGLKMKMGQLNANFNERFYDNGQSPGAMWQNILADGSMNAHLKHSGKIICPGIQEPICEGDNVAVDGMLFHIERISHAGSISGLGTKIWTTTLDISNGISLESDNNNTDHFTYYSDVAAPKEPCNHE